MNTSDHEPKSLTAYGSTVQFTDSGGSGPAILLIHAGVFSGWFLPLASEPALAGFRVVRAIRPGYAFGDRGEAAGSVEHQAVVCAALADSLDLAEVTVVAHSSGSVIALELGMLRPDLLGSLVIGEPPLVAGLADPADMEFLDQVVGPVVGQAIGAAHGGDLDAAFDTFMNAICGPEHRAVVPRRSRIHVRAHHGGASDADFGVNDALRISLRTVAPPRALYGLSAYPESRITGTGRTSPGRPVGNPSPGMGCRG